MRKALILLALIMPGIMMAQSLKYSYSKKFEKAVRRESRTRTGQPGANYFQNQADYKMDIKVHPENLTIEGKASITYTNNSPRELKYLVLRTYNDIFKKGGEHFTSIEPEDIGKEVKIKSIKINGKEPKKIDQRRTIRYVDLNDFIQPNSTNTIEIEWENFIPAKTQLRGGVTPEGGIFASYFYPQIAVYDDLVGWDRSSYNGNAEFYNEFGNFDVNIEVPQDYMVWATGEMENAKEVLSPKVYTRYMTAKEDSEPISIITQEMRDNQEAITANKERVTYNFKADQVNDFTFGLSNTYVWEAQSIPAGKNSKRKVLAQLAYATSDKNFSEKGLDYVVKSIEGLSNNVYGIDFPFPEMTVFHGTGGIESPMMVYMSSGHGKMNLMFLASHEIGHTYFPMYVGTNENLEGWIDEGLTTLMPTELQLSVDSSYHAHQINTRSFAYWATSNLDATLDTDCSTLGDPQIKLQSYGRSSVALRFLRSTLGEDVFNKSLRTFIETWAYKHPTSEDLLNTFETVSGKELDWFFVPWMQMLTYPDMGIQDFKMLKKNRASLKVVNHTQLPLPIALTITYKDGSKSYLNYNASTWKNGPEFTLPLQNAKNIQKIELGNLEIPDSFKEDNVMEI